jgi:adenylate cyclase
VGHGGGASTGERHTPIPQRTTSRSSPASRPTRIILNTTGGSAEERRRNRGNGQGARLCAHTSYGGRMNFTLTEGLTTIGRKDGNTIVLADPKVSKEHCIIRHEAGIGYAIQDLHSANGVKVNDALLPPDTPHSLLDGDSLVIGSVALVFYDSHAKAPRGSLGNISRRGSEAQGGQQQQQQQRSQPPEHSTSLVTILPAEATYDDTITIQGEVERLETDHFPRASEITDLDSMRADYEKLRLVYEMSRRPATESLQEVCAAALGLLFDILPFERGVVMIHDKATGVLGEIAVRRRTDGGKSEGADGEILISSTIINRVIKSGKGLVTVDAIEDPSLGMSDSVRRGQIRSAICMPLVSHQNVGRGCVLCAVCAPSLYAQANA